MWGRFDKTSDSENGLKVPFLFTRCKRRQAKHQEAKKRPLIKCSNQATQQSQNWFLPNSHTQKSPLPPPKPHITSAFPKVPPHVVSFPLCFQDLRLPWQSHLFNCRRLSAQQGKGTHPSCFTQLFNFCMANLPPPQQIPCFSFHRLLPSSSLMHPTPLLSNRSSGLLHYSTTV